MKKDDVRGAKGTPRTIRGILSVTAKAVGYVEHDGGEEDIEIDPTRLNTGLHGDTVDVRILGKNARGRTQGEVTAVVERVKTSFVGTLEVDKGKCFLIPDNRKMYIDILVENPPRDAASGVKALVKISAWTNPKENPLGEIVEIIGRKGEHETEMRAIVLERGFTPGFPPGVEEEAARVAPTDYEAEAKRRRDFRDVTTFTIDPVDAKDFDDAISVKMLGGGRYEIGIHIADVSHYVRPNTVLDREAVRRGTSIYLVDRTIPMLPEVLSNNVCSLMPKVDRLAFSAVFTLDDKGIVHDRWFGETVIHSNRRFTYEDAQEVLDKKDGEFYDELALLSRISKEIRAERARSGAIAFEQDEVKFKLDAAGKPIEIYKKTRINTMLIIEDFMLLANREVAAWVYNRYKGPEAKNAVFVYRIHDAPDPEKIDELAIFLRAIGYDLEHEGGAVSGVSVNKLFKQIEGAPEESLIKTATMRSMAKAVYSTKNIGHFGLAFRYYTHFTSPIRRYPDVMVHRAMKRHLDGTPIPADEFAHYERLAIQSSEREIAAAQAERDSIKYKQVEYMRERVGQTFDGVISGITEWGLYVEEVNTRADGLVRVRTLGDDFYTHDAKSYRLVGEKTGKKHSLGDKVRVKLVGADLEARTLDWTLV